MRPGVWLLNPGRGGPASVEESWVSVENGSERLGVPPAHVVDYLAMVGDSSDNVPGAKGIGEKGAQKLLAEYGDLDTILARAAEVTAKRTREALLSQGDSARLSKELVTIKRDVPIELDVEDFVLREPDRDGLIRILTELEFFTLARRLAGQGVAGAMAGDGSGTAEPEPTGVAVSEAMGPYPNGSTGEFTRFTVEERRRTIQIVCDQAAGRVPILAGAAEANVVFQFSGVSPATAS